MSRPRAIGPVHWPVIWPLVPWAVACGAGGAAGVGDAGTDGAATDSGAPTAGPGASTGEGGDTGSIGDPPCDLLPPSEPHVDALVHLGRAQGDTFIEILDVVADGDTVYSCTGTQGLTIWDASNPVGPKLVVENVGPIGLSHAQFPRCQHVDLDPEAGRVAITSRGDEIQPTPWVALYDVSDPAAPTTVATWSGEESIEGAVIRGDRIYAAAHTAGVLVFETVGETLEVVGRYAEGGSDAWLPTFVGDLLYVAEGVTGIRVYDVSGDNPVVVTTIPIPGSSKDLVTRDGVGYVASSSHLVSIDVSQPEQPAVLGETATLGTALAVAPGRDSMVFVAEWDEVRGYDASDPTDMRQVVAEVLPTDDVFSRVLALDAAPDTGLVFGGEWRGMHVLEQRASAGAPDIWATPGAVQYGAVEVGERADRVVVLRNSGEAPLRIFEADTDHPDISVDRACVEIPPGGSEAIEVHYAPTEDILSLQARLAFRTDDPDEDVFTVVVSGNFSGVGIGDPVPPFELMDLDGNVWSSEGLKGQVAVLAYFATF